MKATIMPRQHNKITINEHFVYIFSFYANSCSYLLVGEQHYLTLVMETGTKILTCWSFFIQDQIYTLLLRDLNVKRGTTLKHKIKL